MESITGIISEKELEVEGAVFKIQVGMNIELFESYLRDIHRLTP